VQRNIGDYDAKIASQIPQDSKNRYAQHTSLLEWRQDAPHRVSHLIRRRKGAPKSANRNIEGPKHGKEYGSKGAERIRVVVKGVDVECQSVDIII
jgi:hypothetical protein